MTEQMRVQRLRKREELLQAMAQGSAAAGGAPESLGSVRILGRQASGFGRNQAPKTDRLNPAPSWEFRNRRKSFTPRQLARILWDFTYLCWVNPHIGPRPSAILGRRRPLSPSTDRQDAFGIQGQHFFEPHVVLPAVVEVVLVQEAFKAEPELGQANAVGVIGEGEAALVRNAVIFAVEVKPVQVGIIPTQGDLKGVMQVGDGVVALAGATGARSSG
jgi:hypothetical protein